MHTLEHIAEKNNLQMQEWVNKKLESCESQLKLWNLRLKDRGYSTSISYINYQIGKYTLEKEYFKYFKHLLEIEFNNFKKNKGENFNQIKL